MNDDRKIAFLIGDGMADYPIPELGNRTPLEYARTPRMDSLARHGILGLARTVPPGMPPGSDTANLSIFGYDPRESYSGRAPLEAINMGLELGPGDVAFRCNIVSIENGVMKDFSAGHIDSAFTRIVIDEVKSRLDRRGMELYAGVSYRNILIWRDYPYSDIIETVPPHDIQGQVVDSHLPRGEGREILREIMEFSTGVIAGSAAVRTARDRFRGDPRSLWLWGGGRKPNMRTLREKAGLRGFTISAVDLIHGIGRAAGLEPLEVPGATGYIDTDYGAKARAGLEALERGNFVFLHVESPDESGHEGNLEHKIRAIEDFDAKVVGPVMEGLERFPRYALAVLPDHPTPLSLRTHTPDPVPFAMLWSDGTDPSLAGRSGAAFTEKDAASTGLFLEKGHLLLDLAINKMLRQVTQ